MAVPPAYPGIPRWVKVAIGIAILLIVLLVAPTDGRHGRAWARPPPDPAGLMVAPPAIRKLLLVTHVVASVGWLGAALAYLALPPPRSRAETRRPCELRTSHWSR